MFYYMFNYFSRHPQAFNLHFLIGVLHCAKHLQAILKRLQHYDYVVPQMFQKLIEKDLLGLTIRFDFRKPI